MKQNCAPENGCNGQFYACPRVPSHFSHVQLFATHGPWPSRFLCPWDFPGKNTGVGWDALLQGVFLTQGLNPHLLCLLHCGFFTDEPLGKPNFMYTLPQFLKTGKKKKQAEEEPILQKWSLFCNILQVLWTYWLTRTAVLTGGTGQSGGSV